MFVVDKNLLREPNLWVPRKQPIGPVKIDWGNPLTNNLVEVLLFKEGSPDAPIALYSKLGPTAVSAGTPVYQARLHGISIASSANASIESDVTYSQAGMVDGGFSVLYFGGGTASSTDIAILGSPDAFPQVWLDTDSGSLRLGQYNGAARYGANLATGPWELSISCRQTSSGSVTGYSNGILQYRDQAAGSNSYGASTISRLGANALKFGLQSSYGSWCYLSCVWSVALSEKELRSASLDPYQFLESA